MSGVGPKPVCFMVMPFRRRKVEGNLPPGAPAEIDCDALWDRGYRPAIERLGYLPIRADGEAGSVIVKDMLERLACAHLVLADVTLPNGNVYYEVGLRHAACRIGCITFAASWSRQLFDIEQFRSVRYDLTDGAVSDVDAAALQAKVLQEVPRLCDTQTPWYELVPSGSRVATVALREQAEQVSALQARMQAVRLAPRGERGPMVEALLADVAVSTTVIPELATELLVLVRDFVGWASVTSFIGRLPPGVRALPFVQEQGLLALAQSGQPLQAIGHLEMLIAAQGATPERHGLIGGRYKRLWLAAKADRTAAAKPIASVDERRYLNKAIEHYTLGMELDYNQYFCATNVAQLLVERGSEDDGARAQVVEQFVMAACGRGLTRGEQDPWLRPTLLAAAFRARDVARATTLTEQVEEDAGLWQLASLLIDLRLAVQRAQGHPEHETLRGLLDRLETLVV
jgi:hypothetical protein